MKKKNVARLLAAAMTMSMLTVGMTGCGSGNKDNSDTSAADADVQATVDDTKQDTAKPASDAADAQTEANSEADAEGEDSYTVLTDADGPTISKGIILLKH